MTSEPTLRLDPKAAFTADRAAASAHTDLMASPAFQRAASQALLELQFAILGPEPAMAAVAAFELRGAHKFLRTLLNLGLPQSLPATEDASTLEPPEEWLKRPLPVK